MPTIQRYAKFETYFTLPNQTGNPFDPQVNDVDALVTGPGASPQTVPAFWDGDRWRVRYAPSRPGLYSLRIERNGKLERPIGLTASRFRCIPSVGTGFVRRSKAQVQGFAFDSGAVYYPLGIDVAWINPSNASYPQYFTRMHRSGMNWARVWMNAWDGKNLEWAASKADNPPIGSYSLSVARYWDSIFDAADKNGVYIQMTLQHHGQYTAHVDPNWQDNPLNVANGGFLKNPDDFFTDARAKSLTKAKYRYIVARYGYSTHLMAFELFNEIQNDPESNSHFQDVVAWHTEMANYIRSIDPYHHLITTSNSPADSPLFKTPIDYGQIHIYVPDIVSSVKAVNVRSYSKPMFIGEWGQQGGAPENHDVVERVVFTSLATPMAGAAEWWEWDHMDQLGAWPIYASANGFLKADHIASLNQSRSVDVAADAAGSRSDLTFSTPLGWAKSTTLDAQITPSGQTHGTEGMSSFLQGTGHTDMQLRPFAFHVRPSAATQFVVAFGQVSNSGAHPDLTLDGQAATMQQADFPKSDANHDSHLTLAMTVPAGPHTITLGNTGPDWINISSITVKNYAPPLSATARESTTSATFYVAARIAMPVHGGLLTLPGLAPGRYKLSLWSPHAGQPIPAASHTSVVFRNGALKIPLPNFTDDIAGVVVKQ